MVAVALGVTLFICLLWAAVLAWAVGWLADLIWGRPPWSLLAYLGVALVVSTAAGVIGYRECRAGPRSRGSRRCG